MKPPLRTKDALLGGPKVGIRGLVNIKTEWSELHLKWATFQQAKMTKINDNELHSHMKKSILVKYSSFLGTKRMKNQNH